MRFKIIPLVALVSVVLLGACRKSATNQNANSNAANIAQDATGGAASAGEKIFFRGRIAYELKIEMTLLREGERLTGTYFYPRVGKNIDVKGSVDKSGNVELRESDESGKETGVFKGKWNPSTPNGLTEIEGKWSKPDGSKETEFRVTQQSFEFSATVRVAPKVIREANKELRYSLDAEYPQIEGDTRFEKFNREAKALVTKDVAAFKASETPQESEEESDPPSETQTSTLDIGYQVRLATDDLISVEFHEGQYSRGAAHGNSYTAVLNYDVKNGKKLALADLFNPKSNYLSVISAYCIKDLRDQAKRDKDSMIDEDMMKSGTEPRADNYEAWTITRKGLWIVFDPYQVAAYAAGPQHVLVPFSALRDIVKPDGPIGRFSG